MFARLVTFAIVVVLAGPALAAPESYTVDPRHSFPSFEINHYGFSTYRGRFNKMTGHITLDREAKKVAAEIVIDANTIDTGLDELEARLRKPDYFDTAKYPTITFKAANGRFEGDALKTLDGELTIRGQTKPVTLNLTHFACGPRPVTKRPQCGADAVATIKRSDFGMTRSLPEVGDEVKLLIQVEAFKD